MEGMDNEPEKSIPKAPLITLGPMTKKVDPYFEKLLAKANKESTGDPQVELNRKAKKPEDKDPSCALEGFGVGGAPEVKSNENKVHCPRCENYFLPEEMASHNTSHSSQILDWLYLGGLRNANNHKELTTRTNIKYILNAGYEIQNYFPAEFTYLKLELDDTPDFEISKYFDQAIEFIAQAKDTAANILVHCQQGISRSATLTIAYLIAKENMNLKSALELLKLKRPIANPNNGFMEQLIKFEYKIHKSVSIETAVEFTKSVENL